MATKAATINWTVLSHMAMLTAIEIEMRCSPSFDLHENELSEVIRVAAPQHIL